MSCIYRSRWHVRWLGMNDLDEVFVAEGNLTVAEELRTIEARSPEPIDSIACCNRWIRPGLSGDYSLLSLRYVAPTCSFRIQKSIVRTEFVYYFCVHILVSGVHNHIVRSRILTSLHFRKGVAVSNGTEYHHIQRFAPHICTDYSQCDARRS
jgi:hypothetical protein